MLLFFFHPSLCWDCIEIGSPPHTKRKNKKCNSLPTKNRLRANVLSTMQRPSARQLNRHWPCKQPSCRMQQPPWSQHLPRNPLGRQPQRNPLGRHLPRNPLGRYLLRNPLGQQPQRNPLGWHLPRNPLGRHLPRNLLGRHLPRNPSGRHLPRNPLGRQSQRNPLHLCRPTPRSPSSIHATTRMANM
jgi:hypothetical protein